MRKASHDFTVNLIKQTKDNLSLLIVSPADEFKVPLVRALTTQELPPQQGKFISAFPEFHSRLPVIKHV